MPYTACWKMKARWLWVILTPLNCCGWLDNTVLDNTLRFIILQFSLFSLLYLLYLLYLTIYASEEILKYCTVYILHLPFYFLPHKDLHHTTKFEKHSSFLSPDLTKLLDTQTTSSVIMGRNAQCCLSNFSTYIHTLSNNIMIYEPI